MISYSTKYPIFVMHSMVVHRVFAHLNRWTFPFIPSCDSSKSVSPSACLRVVQNFVSSFRCRSLSHITFGNMISRFAFSLFFSPLSLKPSCRRFQISEKSGKILGWDPSEVCPLCHTENPGLRILPDFSKSQLPS
jgi:hypothetical protein